MKRRLPQLDLPVPRKRMLSSQERELWYTVMQTHRLPEEEEPVPAPAGEEIPAPRPSSRRKSAQPPQALGKDEHKRIRKGTRAIHATLDLHGLTVEAAYSALVQFIARMRGETARIVLIITGKGRAPQSGILRLQLPRWLEIAPLSEQVGAYSPAQEKHGGQGAWYVHIRKNTKVRP